MRFPKWILFAVPVAAGLIGAGYASSRPPAVPVTQPVRRLVAETIAASGEVRGQTETRVGGRSSGRVARLLVRAGSLVRAGQVVAELDDTVLRTELARAGETLSVAEVGVRQAEDARRTAEAQYRIASRRPLPSEIARLRADTEQAEAVAEARVASARQRLTELERGATQEQRQQIAAQVAQAEVALEKAERDATRRERLYEAGAIARADADDARTAWETAKKNLENLRARQQEILAGPRSEQVEQARAELNVAQATVTGARESGAAQIEQLLSQPRPEDVSLARNRIAEAERAIEAARARVNEARLARAVAEQRLAETIVTAPFDGTVTDVFLEPGDNATPGQPILRLVRAAKPEIEVELDEEDLGRVKPGMRAVVTTDAYPGKTLNSRLDRIEPRVDSSRGTARARFTPLAAAPWLRPGLTVSVNLVIEEGRELLVLPVSAVTTILDRASVLVVRNGVLEQREVKIGPVSEGMVPIREGLTADDMVVRDPAGRKAEEKVEIRADTGGASKEGKGR